MRKIPVVSIVIITFNQNEFIKETIESCLQQDYENFEIIIADDGSTDGTVDIIVDYSEKYPDKIKPIIGNENLGITGNCNRGLKECVGDYVVLVGGDDILLPTKISKQVKWLEETGADLCYHDVEVFDSKTNRILYLWSEKYKLRKGDASTLTRFGCIICAVSVMVRRSSIPTWGFDSKIKMASDWLFYIETLVNGKGIFGYVDGILARYRRHDRNITNETKKMNYKEELLTLDIVIERYNELKKYANKYRNELIFLQYYNMHFKNNKTLSNIILLMVSLLSNKIIIPFNLLYRRFFNKL